MFTARDSNELCEFCFVLQVSKVSLARLVCRGLQEPLAWMVCQVYQVYKVKK